MVYYHGGLRWKEPPFVQKGRKGRYEVGPGIYLTNSLQTARKYAKGPRIVQEVVLSDRIRWLDEVTVSTQEALSCLESLAGLKGKVAFETLLRAYITDSQSDSIGLGVVVNLATETSVLSGEGSPALAKWLVSKGVDASRYRAWGGDTWVMVYNPKIVVSYKKYQES